MKHHLIILIILSQTCYQALFLYRERKGKRRTEEKRRRREKQHATNGSAGGDRLSGMTRGPTAPDGGHQPQRGHGLFGAAPPCIAKNGQNVAPLCLGHAPWTTVTAHNRHV
jgi:hypothetical protein